WAGRPPWAGNSSRPTRDSLPLTDLARRLQVPDFHGPVPAAGVQPPAVGAERQAADQAGVAAEAVDRFPGPAVPNLHGAVLAPGGDPPALVVRAERHRVHVPAVTPPEGLKFLAVPHVPDLDRVLRPARHQPPAVRAEGDVQARPRSRDPRAEGE